MHTIREITRLATMLAGLIAPQLRLGFASATSRLHLDYALAPISCEHCRLSRNNPHCAPRHVIYYYVPPARKLVLSLQLTVAQCSILRYRGMKCKNWTAHTPIAMQRSLSTISRVVLPLLFSIIAFILSSSTSAGRPVRGAFSKSKYPEQKRADQLCHWLSVNGFSP